MLDKLIQAVKDYQREVTSGFPHSDAQDYWRRELNKVVAEAEQPIADVPIDLGNTPVLVPSHAEPPAPVEGHNEDPA